VSLVVAILGISREHEGVLDCLLRLGANKPLSAENQSSTEIKSLYSTLK